LRAEGVEGEDILVMDWWCDCEMAPKKGETVNKPIDREGVQRIIAEQMKSERAAIVAEVVAGLKPPRTSIWSNPWAIALGSALVAGLLVYGISELRSHGKEDLKRDIALEVSSQLHPVQEKLEQVAEDVAKIKGAEHISQNQSTSSDPLTRFAQMNEAQLAENLPALKKVAERPPSGVQANKTTISAIAERLTRANKSTPDYWPTVLQFIQFASSSLSSANVPPRDSPDVVGIFNSSFRGPVMNLDHRIVILSDGELQDITIRNSRIVFRGKLIKLKNVVFVDCVFEFEPSVRQQQPPPYLRQAVEQLLASNFLSIESAG
jgi:hypothetical protein